MPKYGIKRLIWVFLTKNALFRYFWARIFKTYCHIWNRHPKICLFTKFCEKTKMPKFEDKNAWLSYFWARISKSFCHIWNEHPQIFQKCVFNSCSEFWYRVLFFKAPGSASPEGQGPGPGPLYKVCPPLRATQPL